MSQYRYRTHKPCTELVAACKLMHIIDARCFSGSEIALILPNRNPFYCFQSLLSFIFLHETS